MRAYIIFFFFFFRKSQNNKNLKHSIYIDVFLTLSFLRPVWRNYVRYKIFVLLVRNTTFRTMNSAIRCVLQYTSARSNALKTFARHRLKIIFYRVILYDCYSAKQNNACPSLGRNSFEDRTKRLVVDGIVSNY